MTKNIEYDARGNYHETDSLGKNCYYRTVSGHELWTEFDDEGRLIHQKSSCGNFSSFKYDTNGNIIYRASNEFEAWSEYDLEGNLIYEKDCVGLETWFKNGKRVRNTWPNGLETKFEYDSDGNEIHWENSKGYGEWMTYDSRGNCIYSKRYNPSKIVESFMKYDLENNLIGIE